MYSLNKQAKQVSCAFFGHRNCPETIAGELEAQIERLILQYHVQCFYVGHEGMFDSLVLQALIKLERKYPSIDYAVVQAYLNSDVGSAICSHRLFPEVLNNVHPRFAIDRRNRWMIDMSDIVVVFVNHDWGGAAKFAKIALQKGRLVINLAK